MTKTQRRKIYEIALWCIGDCFDEGGVCWLLMDIYNPHAEVLDHSLFPEFEIQRPSFSHVWWWPFTPQGNEKRRIALEKAIQLTYK